ncbi:MULTISPECIES: ABC transporter ATP-binding protein/permease [Ramlibacter]|uniref:ATP-binding cassette domain-containing protein n=1 Tax=Ramlibacter pinisoli TaxID=2682844 RepID=A0A6N8IWE4_9BURK|nr:MULTISPECIES: ABC transporter ATP-binding protein/permease [Ramlibacter]MBA2965339.1 ABC transporter ATP-binding protein/permease [Ramlibacter sp. CGMCC 1.13660]MVQ30303.1 ATP-binding cassette domain-containing protein [Ramlibacter pinisoli]
MTLTERFAAAAATTRRIWALTTPYFGSDEKWRARGLLAAIVVLNLASVYLLVLLNDWNRTFYDALQDKNQAVFWHQLGRFTYLAFALIVVAVYRFWLTQLLEMRWRAWMTRYYLGRWLHGHAFYRMELARFNAAAGSPDNPDQRIQEDLNLFTSSSVSLSMGLLNAVVTLVSFVGILWTLSGTFSFTVGGTAYAIPGFMVWAAIAYCLVGSLLTHWIGRVQIPLNFRQQRLEADFRHHMVRVREYSEAIALDRGQAVERQQLDLRFSHVLRNWLQLLKAQKNLTWFTSFFGQAAVVFPFLVAAPRFFSGAIQLGELMQIASAFGQVQDSLAWLVDNYSSLAAWRATADRLTSFEHSVTAQEAQPAGAQIAVGEELATDGLDLALPGGAALLGGLALRARPGDHVLVKGPSGSGKSTLFRAIAGIWPFAHGRVTVPADTMAIPQQPYFPDGRLRDALAYPEAAAHYGDDALRQALDDALLPDLKERLDDQDAWSQKLSGGERQRLALARVFLKDPRWVLADEATGALDAEAEQVLYRRLIERLDRRGGGLVSIAHRPSLEPLHGRRWELVRNGAPGPAWALREA